MGKAWTKEQETEQLRKISNLIEETEEGSYIRMAFAGCVKMAAENIEYDWGNSYLDTIQYKDQEIARLGRECDRLNKEWEKMHRTASDALIEIDKLKAECKDAYAMADNNGEQAEEWEKHAHELSAMYTELEQKSLAKDAEIMRLKAEIYDLVHERRVEKDD